MLHGKGKERVSLLFEFNSHVYCTRMLCVFSHWRTLIPLVVLIDYTVNICTGLFLESVFEDVLFGLT